MSLTTREQCQDKNAVWTELKNSYDKKRNWTQNDFVFTCPSTNDLEKIRPPYKVDMNGTATPPKPSDTGDWRRVEIVGTEVSSGNQKRLFAGRVKNH